MKEEKNKIVEYVKVSIIVILCFATLIKIYHNKGVNEQQQIEIDMLKENMDGYLTENNALMMNDKLTEKIMTIWMTTLNETGFNRLQDFFDQGNTWCLNYQDMTFAKSLYADEYRYPGQIMVLRYIDPDPIDPMSTERFVALYRDGQVKCYNEIAPLTEMECERLCASEVPQ
ncbi:hypothetical protein KY343_05770 [Candidatus Woesearchaeota archaeon]|nr:hypothetical protein [Candidatus Woesearchaeota archaeon]